MWEKGVVLEHETDPTRFGWNVNTVVCKRTFCHGDCSSIRLLETRYYAQGSRFSTTARSQERKDFSWVNRKTNILYYRRVRKTFCNGFNCKQWCHLLIPNLLSVGEVSNLAADN